MKNGRKRYLSRRLRKRLAPRPSATAKTSSCKPLRTKSTKTRHSNRLSKIVSKSCKSRLVKESSSGQKRSRICQLCVNSKTAG